MTATARAEKINQRSSVNEFNVALVKAKQYIRRQGWGLHVTTAVSNCVTVDQIDRIIRESRIKYGRRV